MNNHPAERDGTPPFKVNFSGAKSRDLDGEIVKYRVGFW